MKTSYIAYCTLPLFKFCLISLPAVFVAFFLCSFLHCLMFDYIQINVIILSDDTTCNLVEPWYRQHLPICFIQQGMKFTEGSIWMTLFLLELWYDITHMTDKY